MTQEKRIRQLEKEMTRVKMLLNIEKRDNGKVKKGRPDYRMMVLKHMIKK